MDNIELVDNSSEPEEEKLEKPLKYLILSQFDIKNNDFPIFRKAKSAFTLVVYDKNVNK